MTDKHIKDYCKNCDVEPPAMKFKCPKCEHNPDNENFAKDINVPSKEQIIIDGEKEDCKILFRCKHIDDLAAYNMIRNGIKITPENAPIGDFELMLIENTDSPFGFSSVCKRNNKEDVWEYSGFGHSGACSIVTALLKRLDRKTQECEEYFKQRNNILEECKRYQEEIGKLQKSQFCVAYEKDCHKVCKQQNCAIKNSYSYRKALEEIEEIANELILETNESDSCYYKDECGPDCYPKRRIIELEKQEPQGRTTYCQYEAVDKILDIINKAKGENNENT